MSKVQSEREMLGVGPVAERVAKGLIRRRYGFPTGNPLVFFQETEVKCGIAF